MHWFYRINKLIAAHEARFCVFIVPVTNVSIVSHPSIENVWEGQSLTFVCTTTAGTYVSYDWFWNDAPVPYDGYGDTLSIHGLSAQNTGLYMCVASNRFNDTTLFNSSGAVSVYINGTINTDIHNYTEYNHYD